MSKSAQLSAPQYISGLLAFVAVCLSLVPVFQPTVRAVGVPDRTNHGPSGRLGGKRDEFGHLPFLFEKNLGQTDSQAKFIARGSGYTLYLAKNEAVFGLKTAGTVVPSTDGARGTRTTRADAVTDHLRMRFAGANPTATITGDSEAVTK